MAGDAPKGDKAANQRLDAAPVEEHEATEARSKARGSTSPGRGFKRFLTVKVLVILVVVSLVAHGVGFAWSHLLAGRDPSPEERTEISLGSYRFNADPSERGNVDAAEFSLYIALIEEVDRPSRQALARRQNRVKQDVEELLRQAHGGDFEDPSLGELKRQLQERINETLGLRAIADVIITDLEIHHKDRPAKPTVETAGSVPWVEKPSS
jgi:flagellar basal body-associated protein FliL